VGNEPKRGVALPDVDVGLQVDVCGIAVHAVRSEIVPVTEDTIHDE
jgi:hypothetical protein